MQNHLDSLQSLLDKLHGKSVARKQRISNAGAVASSVTPATIAPAPRVEENEGEEMEEENKGDDSEVSVIVAAAAAAASAVLTATPQASEKSPELQNESSGTNAPVAAAFEAPLLTPQPPTRQRVAPSVQV